MGSYWDMLTSFVNTVALNSNDLVIMNHRKVIMGQFVY